MRRGGAGHEEGGAAMRRGGAGHDEEGGAAMRRGGARPTGTGAILTNVCKVPGNSDHMFSRYQRLTTRSWLGGKMRETKSEDPVAGVSRRSFLATAGTAGIVTAFDTTELRAQSSPGAERQRRSGRARCRSRCASTARTINFASIRAPRCSIASARRCADRHQEGLRSRPMRRLHGARQRPAREFLPEPRADARRRRDHDHRRPRHAGRAASDAGGVRRVRRLPVRLLHVRPDHVGGRVAQGAMRPDDADVKELMSGNICRCGAYPNIVAAIQQVRRSA